MMASLSGSLRVPQAAISCNERPHPTQRPVSPLTAHTFTQGLLGRSVSIVFSNHEGCLTKISKNNKGALTFDHSYRNSI